MTVLDPAHFKRVSDIATGLPADEWFASGEDELEILVADESGRPHEQALMVAVAALEHLAELRVRAEKFLAAFVKDTGEWSLTTIDCGPEAIRQQCTFLLRFGLTSDSDPWEYGYTYFDVGFRVDKRSASPDVYGRPIKLVIGFH